jgi:hypothetical protein
MQGVAMLNPIDRPVHRAVFSKLAAGNTSVSRNLALLRLAFLASTAAGLT